MAGSRAISDTEEEREKERETECGVRRHRVARRHPLPRVILHYPMRLVGGHVELVAREDRRWFPPLSSRRRKMTWRSRRTCTGERSRTSWPFPPGSGRPGRVSPRCPPFSDVVNLRCRKTFVRPLRDLVTVGGRILKDHHFVYRVSRKSSGMGLNQLSLDTRYEDDFSARMPILSFHPIKAC